MACCLTAPSHYLNQCWLIISKVYWHSSEGNFTAGISTINHCNWLKKYSSKISLTSPRTQRVKPPLKLGHWWLITSCRRKPWMWLHDTSAHYDYSTTRAPSKYPKRRLFVRSHKVSKPRDLYLELSDRSEIWQALRQHGCRCACQISKRCDNLKYQSRGFETSRYLTKRRHFGYWDGAGPLLLTWFNFNLSMDKWSHVQCGMKLLIHSSQQLHL